MAITIRDKFIDRFLENLAEDLSDGKMKRATKMDALRFLIEEHK